MLIDRFGLQDTDPAVQERVYELLRRKTPEERLAMVFQRMEFIRELRAATEHLRGAKPVGLTDTDDHSIL